MVSLPLIGTVLLLVVATTTTADSASSCTTRQLVYDNLGTSGVTLHGTGTDHLNTGGAVDVLYGSGGFWLPTKDVGEPSLNLAFYQNEEKVMLRSISFEVKRADSIVFDVVPKDENEERVTDVVVISAPQDLQGENSQRSDITRVSHHFSEDLDVKEISITFNPSGPSTAAATGMKVENMKVDFQRCYMD